LEEQGEWKMDTTRFFGLDPVEWSTALVGSALIALAVWLA
jgi:hypothetical protein